MVPIAVRNHLSTILGRPIDQKNICFVGGGSINQTIRLQLSKHESFFCKLNSATKFPHLFEKEKNGLLFLEKTTVIKTPKVIDYFVVDDYQVLVLEWIASGSRTEIFWTKFGEQLAILHSITNEDFGFLESNYMGSVPQSNMAMDEWNSFFTEQRIQPLIELCFNKDLLSTKNLNDFNQVLKQLPLVFSPEKPALLHGDLWSGNFMCNQKSEPVLIDPAVYFGHRSVDLGMTTLFGGFDKTFYEAYHYHYPLPTNYKEQWEVCNLYPLLIHLLLFGRSYLSQIEAILNRYQ